MKATPERRFVGCAGWNVPKDFDRHVTGAGTHLERYSRVLSAVEINSSFYRPHRQSTYVRWAATVPADFRFAVKAPKSITHERRLDDVDEQLNAFCDETAGLGDRLGFVLVQLPPSLTFEERRATDFFQMVRDRLTVNIACEPRHPSWFTPTAEKVLTQHEIVRVAADPAVVPEAAKPGGRKQALYFRWHGSPRMYYSNYGIDALSALAERMRRALSQPREVWCIFDNTALGAAFGNALAVDRLLRLSADEQLAEQSLDSR